MLNVISKFKQLCSVVTVHFFFPKSVVLGKIKTCVQCFISGDFHFLMENNSKSLMDNRLMFNSSEKSFFFLCFSVFSNLIVNRTKYPWLGLVRISFHNALLSV